MFKLIFVLFAVLTLEEVSGGGDGNCSEANQAAVTRTQAYEPALATKKADCITELGAVFENIKANNDNQGQFNDNAAASYTACFAAFDTIFNQFEAGLASDIGMSQGDFETAIGSATMTFPTSCIKDFATAAINKYNQARSDYYGTYLDFFNQLA